MNTLVVLRKTTGFNTDTQISSNLSTADMIPALSQTHLFPRTEDGKMRRTKNAFYLSV